MPAAKGKYMKFYDRSGDRVGCARLMSSTETKCEKTEIRIPDKDTYGLKVCAFLVPTADDKEKCHKGYFW
jgi:hypothetical protein